MSATYTLKLGSSNIGNVYSGVGTTPTSPQSWIRPSDWLTIPDTSFMTGSAGGFIGLFAVYTGSANFVALSATNNYYVDWGDGSPITSSAANVTAQKQYDFATISASTYSNGSDGNGGTGSLGYRQVFVRVTPSGSGVNFTGINLQKKHTQTGLPAIPETNWLDIAFGGVNVTSINNIGGSTTYLSSLERCNVVANSSSVSTCNSMFLNCYALQDVNLFNTANATDFGSMFSNCYGIVKIPTFNTSNGTTFTSMFNACYSLITLPFIDTGKSTGFSTFCNSCYSLKNVPLLNMQSSSTLVIAFQQCYSLESVPLFNTAKCTNFQGTFVFCYALKNVPLFNMQSGSNFLQTFANCYSLTSLPAFNTSNATDMGWFVNGCNSLQNFPLLDTGKVATFSSMFANCNSLTNVPPLNTQSGSLFNAMFINSFKLKNVPLINTSRGTNFSQMFFGCSALQSVPPINTQNATTFNQMFQNCTSLQYVPALNTSNTAMTGSGVFTTIFSGCPNLKGAPLSGSRSTISYNGCSLSTNAIIDIFNNLAPTGSVACSIDVRNNWGSSSLSPANIAIATGKNWTVTT